MSSSGSKIKKNVFGTVSPSNSTNPNATRVRSKVVLAFLSAILGMTGADRLYAGAMLSGFIKLALFLIFLTSLIVTLSLIGAYAVEGNFFSNVGASAIVALVVGIILAVWSFVDYIIVLVSCLGRSNTGPWSMGGSKVGWKDQEDVKFAFWLSIVLLLFTVVIPLIISSVSTTQRNLGE